jgi:hypothetical protein
MKSNQGIGESSLGVNFYSPDLSGWLCYVVLAPAWNIHCGGYIYI